MVLRSFYAVDLRGQDEKIFRGRKSLHKAHFERRHGFGLGCERGERTGNHNGFAPVEMRRAVVGNPESAYGAGYARSSVSLSSGADSPPLSSGCTLRGW